MHPKQYIWRSILKALGLTLGPGLELLRTTHPLLGDSPVSYTSTTEGFTTLYGKV